MPVNDGDNRIRIHLLHRTNMRVHRTCVKDNCAVSRQANLNSPRMCFSGNITSGQKRPRHLAGPPPA